jgi:antitoxin ParD1/3/4
MPGTTKRTFSLPDEQSHDTDSLVASGTYATGSEVVRAGLRALQERDAAVETWRRDEVVKTYDAMVSDPSRGRCGGRLWPDVPHSRASSSVFFAANSASVSTPLRCSSDRRSIIPNTSPVGAAGTSVDREEAGGG